ncbi:hypothetical protein D3C81_1546030 [compost metagenome]
MDGRRDFIQGRFKSNGQRSLRNKIRCSGSGDMKAEDFIRPGVDDKLDQPVRLAHNHRFRIDLKRKHSCSHFKSLLPRQPLRHPYRSKLRPRINTRRYRPKVDV